METALEHILISSHKNEMISFMATHPEYFEEAIELAILNKQPYSWRAAWLLWSCMKENDQRVQRYVEKIISVLTSKNEDHQRELLKILYKMRLSEEYEGLLFNLCVTVWKKIDSKPSVRFNAFKMIVKIAQKYPDLKNEITLLTQNQYMESLSSAAQKSIYTMVKELN
jgi:hypothetical protein